jgi:hypothetical protein
MRARIRGDRGRVEGRVFDAVAHHHHPGFAALLDVHQRAAVLQPELGAAVRLELEAHVHVLVREAHVELKGLHDGGDVVALDLHQPLHAARVVGRRALPLPDRERLDHLASAEAHAGLRHQRAVVGVPVEHELAAEARELGAREIFETADLHGREV